MKRMAFLTNKPNPGVVEKTQPAIESVPKQLPTKSPSPIRRIRTGPRRTGGYTYAIDPAAEVDQVEDAPTIEKKPVWKKIIHATMPAFVCGVLAAVAFLSVSFRLDVGAMAFGITYVLVAPFLVFLESDYVFMDSRPSSPYEF